MDDLSGIAVQTVCPLAAPRPADAGLADAVLDPYVNAVHVSLLRDKGQNPAYAQALATGSVRTVTRVYTAIASLRRIGLRDMLVRDERGYSLRTDVPIARVSGR